MPRRIRETEELDETKERRRLVPVEEDLTFGSAESLATPTVSPTQPSPPTSPTTSQLTLTPTILPALRGKVVGDKLSLDVDAEITDISGENYTLNILNVSAVEIPETKPTAEKKTARETLAEEIRKTPKT